VTDADLNKLRDDSIIFTQLVDCPECGATFDVEFDTGVRDEDGLTDLGLLETPATCPSPECGHEWSAEFEGWTNYGDAG